MFQVGDYIVCGTKGVCRVDQVGSLDLDGIPKDKLYYTLTPCYSRGSTVFTPVDNEKIVMRPVITIEEAQQLLEEMKDIDTLWVSNEKARETQYKETLRTCDCRETVKIIKTIYFRKRSRLAQGKKVTFVDEKYFKMAEEHLYGELAIVLNMTPEEAKEHVIEYVRTGKAG